MNLKAAFSKKFGPLPAGVWLALFAGGLYLYRRMRGGGSTSSSGSTSTTPAAPAGIDYGYGAGPADLSTTPDPLNPQQAPSTANLTIDVPGSSGGSSDGGSNDSGQDGGGVDVHDPTTGETTKANPKSKASPHAPAKPKKTRGKPKKPRKAPELISEHGKGQNHLPHPKAKKPQPAKRAGKAKKPHEVKRPRTPSAGGGGTHRPATHPHPKAKKAGGGTTESHHAPTPKSKNPDLGSQRPPGPPPKGKRQPLRSRRGK